LAAEPNFHTIDIRIAAQCIAFVDLVRILFLLLAGKLRRTVHKRGVGHHGAQPTMLLLDDGGVFSGVTLRTYVIYVCGVSSRQINRPGKSPVLFVLPESSIDAICKATKNSAAAADLSALCIVRDDNDDFR
jgi:hypothetical protein